MSIISRRIPSGLGYIPNMTVRAYTVRGGLGGAESCGPNQQWDPNYVFAGIKGQCTPKGSPMTKPPTDWGAIASSVVSSFSAPKSAPTGPVASASAYLPASSGGMSTGTMIAIGLGAAGLLAVVMLTRKK